MSPVHDPRFTTEYKEKLHKSSTPTPSFLVPLIMLVAGAGIVMLLFALSGGEEDRASGLIMAALYPIILAINVFFGMLGLCVLAVVWLGGTGRLGMAALRLAGIYAVIDVLAFLTAPLLLVGQLINGVAFLLLVMWLFEFDLLESFVLGLTTWILKLIAGFIIALTLATLVA